MTRRLRLLAGQPYVAPAAVVPGAPTGVTVAALSSTALFVSWTAPATGGTPTDYEVQYSLTGSSGWTTFADGASTSVFASITGLSASTTYYIRVRASNAAGNGDWSSNGSGSTSAPISVPGTYGATADTGATWDATSASAYSSGTTYAWGDIVSSGGVYYVSMADGNVGNAVTSPTYWRGISQFLYVDSASGNDGTGVVSTNPATAKASPFQTMSAVSSRITNGNGGTRLEPNSMVVFKRGGEYIGNIYCNHIRTSQSITSLSGDGATVTATTPAAHNLVTGVTVTISGATPAGYNAAAVVTVTSPTTFTYANATTGASSGTIVFSSFYGNHFIGNWGTGALPVLKYSDNATISSGSMLVTNRNGLTIRGVDVTGENIYRLALTSVSGTFVAGETVTGGTSGTQATIVRVSTSARLCVQFTSGTAFTGTETITGGTSGATGSFSLGSSGTPNGVELQAYATLRDSKVHHWKNNGVLLGVAATANSSDYTTIINNFVYNNGNTNDFNGAGIDQGVGTDIQIKNNSIYNNGYPGATQNHQVYMGTSGGSTLTNYVFSGNDVYCTSNYGNHGLVLHGNFTTATIQDNRFDSCGNGIGINGGYSSAESFASVTVQRNVITNCGTLPTQSQGYGMLLDSMTSSTIVNNLIAGNALGGISMGISASGGADATTNAVTIAHNTIDGPSTSYYCLNLAGAMTSITIRNNILSNAGSASNQYTIQKASTFSDAQLTLNNNLHYAPGKGSGALVKWDGTDRSLAYLQGTLSKEANGASGNPLFVSASDYNLGASSPARNLGANLSITTDILGAARDATPHAGAYETA